MRIWTRYGDLDGDRDWYGLPPGDTLGGREGESARSGEMLGERDRGRGGSARSGDTLGERLRTSRSGDTLAERMYRARRRSSSDSDSWLWYSRSSSSSLSLIHI